MKKRVLSIFAGSLLWPMLLLTQAGWADPLNTWTVQNDGLTGSVGWFNDVTYGNGLFVAVGSQIATSPDGIHWTVIPGAAYQYGTFTPLNHIVYANGMYVAVGPGVAVTSTDGADWVNNTQVPWTQNGVGGIVYGGGVFVVWFLSEYNDAVSISTNGLAWSGSPLTYNNFYIPTTGDLLAGLVWNGSEFACAFNQGWCETVTAAGLKQLALNPNIPAPWDGGPGPSGGTDGYGSLFYENGTYYLGGGPVQGLGQTTAIQIASGGYAGWTPDKMPSGNLVIQGSPYPVVTYAGGRLVAQNGGAILSTNGGSHPLSWQLNWNVPGFGTQGGSSVQAITFGGLNGIWVAVGGSVGNYGQPTVWTAGGHWTILKLPVRFPTLTLWQGIQFSSGAQPQDLIVGDNGTIAISLNGTTYQQASPTTNQLRGVTASLSGFVAVGAKGTILNSADGTNWTAIAASPTTNLLYGVASGNGLDVAVGANGTVLTSTDDNNWFEEPAFAAGALISVAFGNGQFEALSISGAIFLSTNGVNWSASSAALPGQAGQLSSISFANGQFSGTDAAGDVLSSSDGINWNIFLAASSGTAGVTSSTLVNGRLLMVGSGGSIQSIQIPVPGTGTTEDLHGAAYNGSVYVAVGQQGTIIKSSDGTSWSAPTNYFGTPNSLSAVAYGNGMFVGVGQNSWIVTSTDGDNWNSTSSGSSSADLYDVAFGAGKFVAVGADGTILTSTDGLNWTVQNSQTTDSIEAITYGNQMFVACRESHGSLTSSDGINWNSGGTGLDSLPQGVTAGPGVFVAVNYYGEILTSFDGSNWAMQASTGFNLYDVTYGNGEFVAGTDNGVLFVSPNGTNWSQYQTTANGLSLYAAVDDGSQFVIVGQAGTSLTLSATTFGSLPSATAWDVVPSPSTTSLNGVAFNGETFTLIGDTVNGDLVSTDAFNWTPEGNGLESLAQAVTWGSNVFVEADYYGAIYTSPDGTNWTQRAGTGYDLYSAAYGAGVFVVGSEQGIVFTSTDSVHWSPHHTGLTGELNALVYANGQFVAVANDGTIESSPNGTSWTAQNSPTDRSLNAITYGNGLYAAVGDRGTIVTSPDGALWTLETNAPVADNSLYGVAWGGREFMAVGQNGWTTRSTDGTNWISSSSATVNDLHAVIFAHARFLAVGDNGTILETAFPSAPSQLTSIAFKPGQGISITLNGAANSSYSIEVSTNLLDWTPLTGLTLSGTNGQVTDPVIPLPTHPGRFYRAVPSL